MVEHLMKNLMLLKKMTFYVNANVFMLFFLLTITYLKAILGADLMKQK